MQPGPQRYGPTERQKPELGHMGSDYNGALQTIDVLCVPASVNFLCLTMCLHIQFLSQFWNFIRPNIVALCSKKVGTKLDSNILHRNGAILTQIIFLIVKVAYCSTIWYFIWVKTVPLWNKRFGLNFVPNFLLHRGTIFGTNIIPNRKRNWMKVASTHSICWMIWNCPSMKFGKIFDPIFSFIKEQYLADIKIQIVEQIGCIDAA